MREKFWSFLGIAEMFIVAHSPMKALQPDTAAAAAVECAGSKPNLFDVQHPPSFGDVSDNSDRDYCDDNDNAALSKRQYGLVGADAEGQVATLRSITQFLS